MENQKNKSGRPFVEEKAKNINVYVQPSKVAKYGARKTALLLKQIAELVNSVDEVTFTIVNGEIKTYMPSNHFCSPSCVDEIQ